MMEFFNIGYPYETHLKLKYWEISFAHIVLHYQNGLRTEMGVLIKSYYVVCSLDLIIYYDKIWNHVPYI